MHRTASEITATDRGTTPADRLAYSVAEAAAVVGISERRLWDRIRQRKIASYREGTRRLISRSALEAYVAAREAEAA
jgi:excisionase family DNA binding protein